MKLRSVNEWPPKKEMVRCKWSLKSWVNSFELMRPSHSSTIVKKDPCNVCPILDLIDDRNETFPQAAQVSLAYNFLRG